MLSIFLTKNLTNEFVTYCQQYLTTAGDSNAERGESILLVAQHYCGYLRATGGAKSEISEVAATALLNAKIFRYKGLGYNAQNLARLVEPKNYPPGQYKQAIYKVMMNCDVTDYNKEYLGWLKSIYEALP